MSRPAAALDLQHMPGLGDFGRNQVAIDALRHGLDTTGEPVICTCSVPPAAATVTCCSDSAQPPGKQRGLRCACHWQNAGNGTADARGPGTGPGGSRRHVQTIAGDRDWEEACSRCSIAAAITPPDAVQHRRGPAALPLRLPDLRSRLAWGLSLSLQPLDDAGRMQLLQSLAARRALKLPEDVARICWSARRATQGPGRYRGTR